MHSITLWGLYGLLVTFPNPSSADLAQKETKRAARHTKRAGKKAARLDRLDLRRNPADKPPIFEYDSLPGNGLPDGKHNDDGLFKPLPAPDRASNAKVLNSRAMSIQSENPRRTTKAPLNVRTVRTQLNEPSASNIRPNDTQRSLYETQVRARAYDPLKPSFYGYLGKPTEPNALATKAPARRLQDEDDEDLDEAFKVYDATAPGEFGRDNGDEGSSSASDYPSPGVVNPAWGWEEGSLDSADDSLSTTTDATPWAATTTTSLWETTSSGEAYDDWWSASGSAWSTSHEIDEFSTTRPDTTSADVPSVSTTEWDAIETSTRLASSSTEESEMDSTEPLVDTTTAWVSTTSAEEPQDEYSTTLSATSTSAETEDELVEESTSPPSTSSGASDDTSTEDEDEEDEDSTSPAPTTSEAFEDSSTEESSDTEETTSTSPIPLPVSTETQSSSESSFASEEDDSDQSSTSTQSVATTDFTLQPMAYTSSSVWTLDKSTEGELYSSTSVSSADSSTSTTLLQEGSSTIADSIVSSVSMESSWATTSVDMTTTPSPYESTTQLDEQESSSSSAASWDTTDHTTELAFTSLRVFMSTTEDSTTSDWSSSADRAGTVGVLASSSEFVTTTLPDKTWDDSTTTSVYSTLSEGSTAAVDETTSTAWSEASTSGESTLSVGQTTSTAWSETTVPSSSTFFSAETPAISSTAAFTSTDIPSQSSTTYTLENTITDSVTSTTFAFSSTSEEPSNTSTEAWSSSSTGLSQESSSTQPTLSTIAEESTSTLLSTERSTESSTPMATTSEYTSTSYGVTDMSSNDVSTTSPPFTSTTSDDNISYGTSTSAFTSSSFMESTLTEPLAPLERPLAFIPYKSIAGLFPLEAMVQESDLSVLGGAVRANEKYESLRKVGMTIFAPIDAAFSNLPIDLDSLQGSSSGGDLLRRKWARDGDAEIPREPSGGRSLRRGHLENPFDFGRNLMALSDSDASSVGTEKLNGRGPDNDTVAVVPRQLAGAALKGHGCDPLSGYPCLSPTKYLPAPKHSDMFHAQRLTVQSKNIMEDFEKLVMFHVVKRIVPPGMIEAKRLLEQRTEMKGRTLKIELVTLPDGGQEVLVGGGQARIVEIVQCRNGFIYKIDGPLFPPWNVGAPNLIDFIASSPRFSRLRYLMEQSGMFNRWSLAGPVTMLLIPDNAWRIDGLQVPPCFFKALVRPENTEILSKLLRWTTIPGLWTREDIQAAEWLPNGAAPSLTVTNIDMSLWQTSQTIREEAWKRQKSQSLVPDWLDDTVLEDSSDEYLEYENGDMSPNGAAAVNGKVTLIEGKEVVDWDLRFYNGFGHTVSELPLRPDLDLRGMLWDCMDMFCGECPIVTKFLLKYLDGGGLLPDVTNPKAYIVPPGVRPEWMCSASRNWFPPGWEYSEWYRYLDYAKSGNHKMAHTVALTGWKKASVRNAELLDKLQEAEVHLKHIVRSYGNPNEYLLGEKEDPNLLIGWLRNKRSLEYKPKICDPKSPKHPGVLLDTEDPWEGGEPWGARMVSSARSAFYEVMDRDRSRKFGMEDLRYVSQWI